MTGPNRGQLQATIVDNYDSFTFNIVQYLQELGIAVTIRRNDEKTTRELLDEQPDFFVLSPGPSSPDHAGVCLKLINECAKEAIPLLGICLGHQAIGQAFGGRVVRAPRPMHGKTSPVLHQGEGVFKGLPSPLIATRYHSLIVDRSTLPDVLAISAEADDGTIMGLRHRFHLIEGVQFHPESVLTTSGRAILQNFAQAVTLQ